MTSLALFLALFAERFMLGDGTWRQTNFSQERGCHPFLAWLSDQGSARFLVIGLLLIAIGLINWLLSGWLFGLPGLAFSIFVLLFSLGPQSLEPQVQAWQEAVELGEDDKAKALSEHICGQGKAEDQDVIADCLWPAALTRLFGPVFWFLVFGLFGMAPVGAALYWLVRHQARATGHEEEEEATERECRWLAWLNWLPARVLVYSFALVGDYKGTLDRSRAFRFDEHPDCTSIRVLLILAGRGAMGCQAADDMAKAAMDIIWRALMLWILVAFVFWLVLH